MERLGSGWLKRTNAPAARTLLPVAILLAAAITVVVVLLGHRLFDKPLDEPPAQHTPSAVMLILRGIASSEMPRGQLDDKSALEYARRLGYQGEVLDVAGNTGAENAQARMALNRIRRDEKVRAIYGFSGGGYDARRIWKELNAAETPTHRQDRRDRVARGGRGRLS